MTAVAIVVVDAAARDLLGIESEFGVALAALHVTRQQAYHRDTEAQRKTF